MKPETLQKFKMPQAESLRPKLLKSVQLGEFVQAEYTGKNESGYVPIGDRVLVLPDSAAAVSSGGIQLLPEQVERTTLASETGVVIALGDDAFHWNFDRTRVWEGYKPQPGDRVYILRYSGQTLMGEDGRIYRLMDYGNVGAVKKRTTVQE